MLVVYCRIALEAQILIFHMYYFGSKPLVVPNKRFTNISFSVAMATRVIFFIDFVANFLSSVHANLIYLLKYLRSYIVKVKKQVKVNRRMLIGLNSLAYTRVAKSRAQIYNNYHQHICYRPSTQKSMMTRVKYYLFVSIASLVTLSTLRMYGN